MLVTKVLGNCPSCGYEVFGNVNVFAGRVLRGCGQCKYREDVWLPPIRKKILYLDQPFFSGAFRGKDTRFVKLADRIQRAASYQLLAIPRSSIHEKETRLWKGADELLNFIKRTSRGHEFEREYTVERKQILNAFGRWLHGGPIVAPIEQIDALSDDVHGWDGYFMVDIERNRRDGGREREDKRLSTENLVNLFDEWRRSNNTLEQDVAFELAGAKKIYLNSYKEYVTRVVEGDVAATYNSPIVSMVVEGMRDYLPDEMPVSEQWKLIETFFDSGHFARVPLLYLQSRCYAVLKSWVKGGAYKNRDRALQKLSGFYSDVDHIAHFAPYCDAIALDKPMAELVRHPGLALEATFGVKVFSLQNLDEFATWIDELESSMDDFHRAGLRAAYGL
jgi:hypothetical protein